MACIKWNCSGNVFFVNGITGSNLNDGKTPDSPFKTFAHALDQCVDDHNDIIYALDCWQQETFPISVDVSRVHIIGCDNWNGMYPRMVAPENTAIFEIPGTKSYFEIAHFGLGAGVDHAAIEFVGGIEARGRIHDCWFGWIGAGQDGIRFDGEAPEMMIDNNLFGMGLTRDGIRIAGALTRTFIRDNIFQKVAGIGINIVAESHLAGIIHNKFSLTEATKGKAISFAHANCADALVDQNSAMCGRTVAFAAGVTNPYRDLGSNDWGCNSAQCIIEAVHTFCQCLMPETS